MTETRYMGWSMAQWAEALAWFARRHGFSPLPDVGGAQRVRHQWISAHDDGSQPGSPRLVLVVSERMESRRSERDVLLCDDPRLLPKMAAPPPVEANFAWSANLLRSAL